MTMKLQASKRSQQSSSKTVRNETEILKERSPEKKDRKLMTVWDQYNNIIMKYKKIIFY